MENIISTDRTWPDPTPEHYDPDKPETWEPAAPVRTLGDVCTSAGSDFPGWDAVDEEWSP